MSRTRTITMPIKQKTAHTFDAILKCPQEMFPDAKQKDGWQSFLINHENIKLKFNSNRKQGAALNPPIFEGRSSWDIPMKVVTSGKFSELAVTITKPDQITEQKFVDKMKEAEMHMENMRLIIEEK